MCAEPSPLLRSENLLADGDRAASAGLWREAEHHWRGAGATQRLRWVDLQQLRPRHRRRAWILWGGALVASVLLLVLLTIGSPKPAVSVAALVLTSLALVAMVLAALETGRWLDGTGARHEATSIQERS